MFTKKNFDPKKYYNLLFVSKPDLIKIKELGHEVGLHSHNHPMVLEKLNYNDQLEQYANNLKIVSSILNCKTNSIVSMSHPCGSYNNDTIEILEDLGIQIGFKHSMSVGSMKKINNSKYEIARHDHQEVMRMMI